MAGSSDTPDDRRSGDRVPINQEFSGDGTWVSDLSHGGVFVHGAQLLPVGSMIDLRFTVLLDDPVPIAAIAKVVRHSRKPPGIGVQFTALEPEMRARIDAVLERQQPIDSGTPLRLPEPRHHEGEDGEDLMERWARPAPVGDLSVVPSTISADDDITTSFVRPAIERLASEASEAPTSFFRPPPLPSKPNDA